MYVIGESDRAPVHVSYHSQAYLQAAGAGASAAMLALYHRNVTGEGQHIDVSAQEVVARIIEYHCVFWDMMKVMLARRMAGDNQVRRTQTWPCKDGYVSWQFWGGQTGARWTRALVRWMDSEGMADDYLKTFDWESLDFTKVAQEVVDRYEAPARKFFMAHTRDELLAGALKHDVMLFPVDTVADTLQSSQLAARRFWTEVEHPELGTKITYPGPFAHSNGLPPRINRRAPLIGEHNREVYEQELGISPRELSTLKLAGVV
jgi:crotonobetainyl-CoA:carnitine CoA-transferase CaiB-like acyl-CoA transferase